MRNHKVNFKYEIGDILNDENRNLEIIDREVKYVEKIKNGKNYTARHKWYKYKCLKCGNEDWIEESPLFHLGCGCNACCSSPKKVVKGISDVSTTAPWMMKYFKNVEDAFSNTKYSRKKVFMICPDCGREHIKTIHQVMSNRGLTCPCQDGWSYPNKFMY